MIEYKCPTNILEDKNTIFDLKLQEVWYCSNVLPRQAALNWYSCVRIGIRSADCKFTEYDLV
jgi:hypothetical protein